MKSKKQKKQVLLFGLVGAFVSSIYTAITYWSIFIPSPCSIPGHDPMCGLGEAIHFSILNIHLLILGPLAWVLEFIFGWLPDIVSVTCSSFIAGFIYGAIVGWLFSLDSHRGLP